MSYLRFLGVLLVMLILSFISHDFGVKKGRIEGYSTGIAVSQTIKKRTAINIAVKSNVELKKELKQCIKEHDGLVDKANAEIARLKDDSQACEDKLINSEDELLKNLYPEKVEELEPKMENYQGDSDYTASGFNPVTQEYEDVD